ncbi:hypothetical protein G9A89_022566 [Geosiphon pyriformis]|nr:hypothetical protein G9A89_022566 [Geosiphon pyriformis]
MGRRRNGGVEATVIGGGTISNSREVANGSDERNFATLIAGNNNVSSSRQTTTSMTQRPTIVEENSASSRNHPGAQSALNRHHTMSSHCNVQRQCSSATVAGGRILRSISPLLEYHHFNPRQPQYTAPNGSVMTSTSFLFDAALNSSTHFLIPLPRTRGSQ